MCVSHKKSWFSMPHVRTSRMILLKILQGHCFLAPSANRFVQNNSISKDIVLCRNVTKIIIKSEAYFLAPKLREIKCNYWWFQIKHGYQQWTRNKSLFYVTPYARAGLSQRLLKRYSILSKTTAVVMHVS